MEISYDIVQHLYDVHDISLILLQFDWRNFGKYTYKFNPLLVPHYLILSKSIELSHYHYASHACYVTGRWYLVGQAVTWNLCPISTRVLGQFRTILLVDGKVTRIIKKKLRMVPRYKHLIGHREIRQRPKEGHVL